jgi:hypothetical protein
VDGEESDHVLLLLEGGGFGLPRLLLLPAAEPAGEAPEAACAVRLTVELTGEADQLPEVL